MNRWTQICLHCAVIRRHLVGIAFDLRGIGRALFQGAPKAAETRVTAPRS